MLPQNADHTRTFFIDHDGLTYVYPSGHWYKIECQEVPGTPARPAGLKYSLAFFAADGQCLVRYDNSHAVKITGRPNPEAYDHWHRFRHERVGSGTREETVPYGFTTAERLLTDFFEAVEKHIHPD